MKQDNPLRIISSELYTFGPGILIYAIILSFLFLATPISVQSLVSTVSFGPYLKPLVLLSVFLLFFLGVLAITKLLQYLLVERMQRLIYARLTSKISKVFILKKALKQEVETDLSLSNKYFDIVLIQKKAATLITDGLFIGLQLIIGLSLISVYHPFFILFSILIVLAAIMPLYIYLNTAEISAVSESDSKYKAADFIQKYRFGVENENIKADVKNFDDHISDYLDLRRVHFQTVFKVTIVYLFSFAFLNALLLLVGGYLVIVNELSVGQLVAAEIVINGILYHFFYAHKYVEGYFDLYAACTKLAKFFNAEKSLMESESFARSELSKSKKFKNKFYYMFKSFRMVKKPNKPGLLLKRFVAGLFAVVLLSVVTPWYQSSLGEGRLTAFDPNDRLQYITANVSGRVDEWLVRDGQVVQKGEAIVRILDNDPQFMERLEVQRDALFNKLQAAKAASDTAKLNYDRQKSLLKDGLSSQKDYELARIKYQKLLSEEASAANSLSKAETSLSRQALQTIEAPRAGRILKILLGSGSVNVKTGDKLVQFVPAAVEDAVELFLSANDLPLVSVGRKVRLQFEGWPAVQFFGWPSVAVGSFGGVVKSVDPVVSGKGQFRVIVVEDPDEEKDWPFKNFLYQGTRVTGLVILDRVSLFYEFWRKVNGFPKSFDESAFKEIKMGK